MQVFVLDDRLLPFTLRSLQLFKYIVPTHLSRASLSCSTRGRLISSSFNGQESRAVIAFPSSLDPTITHVIVGGESNRLYHATYSHVSLTFRFVSSSWARVVWSPHYGNLPSSRAPQLTCRRHSGRLQVSKATILPIACW